MNARGFTLLEVLVALAILGIAIVASIQGFAQGLRLLKLSGDHQEAMLIADEKLRELVAPTEGREDGVQQRYQWSRTVTKVATPELSDTPRPVQWAVFQLEVQVRWDERREVKLTTLRTLATNPSGTPLSGTTPITPGASPGLTPGVTPPGVSPPGRTPTPGAPRR